MREVCVCVCVEGEGKEREKMRCSGGRGDGERERERDRRGREMVPANTAAPSFPAVRSFSPRVCLGPHLLPPTILLPLVPGGTGWEELWEWGGGEEIL